MVFNFIVAPFFKRISGSVDYSTEGATLQLSTKNSITSSDSSPLGDPEALREVFLQAQRVSSEKGIPLGLAVSIDRAGIDSCTEPWRKAFVCVEGEVNPCCGYDFSVSRDQNLRGNLLKQDLREFWYTGLYDSLRKGLTTGDPLPGCKACYKQMFTQS
jgi:hypothetical protein